MNVLLKLTRYVIHMFLKTNPVYNECATQTYRYVIHMFLKTNPVYNECAPQN